ncbi:Copper chaperone [Handroanthus impetiginosus]|uniref:Copper chaperone n=1 Tax=Handroanthus impetiginosus TaxID=429701 RepID=A0A2G9G215_9LAMI|nr:Copper chaperone [Handroanthus impetiginosus]
MVPEMEKPSITEIKVRMDCNGCVNKIKKALHGITGICHIDVDFSEQKLIVRGWADPHKLVKAIKKTRKNAIICSHTEQSDQPAEPATETKTPHGEAPPSETADPPIESTQIEATQPADAPKEQPHPENRPLEENSSSESCNDATTSQSGQPPMQRGREEVHVIHHYPPDYGYQYPYGPSFQQGYNCQWIGPHGDPRCRGEPFQPPRPVYVAHSYNTYEPSPNVTEYAYPRSPPRYSQHTHSSQWNGLHSDPRFRGEPFQPHQPVYAAAHSHNTYKPSPYGTECAYPRSPPRYSHYSEQWNSLHGDPGPRGEPFQPLRPVYTTHSYNTYTSSPYVTEYVYPPSPPRYSHYSGPARNREDCYYSGSNGNGNITSMFSDVNPNACRII